jgi:Peptidase A4 family
MRAKIILAALVSAMLVSAGTAQAGTTSADRYTAVPPPASGELAQTVNAQPREEHLKDQLGVARLTLLSSQHVEGRRTTLTAPKRLSARLGLSPATLSYLGGRVTLTVSASHAARCFLSSQLLAGRNPHRVSCNRRYSLGSMPAAAATHSWSFTLTARGASGRVARSRRTLTQQGPPFDTSSNWSGYVVPSSSPVTSVSGQFTVPTLNCSRTPNAGVSAWVGTGGNGGSSGDLLQTGVESDCVDGVQSNNAGWWEEAPEYPEVDFKSMSVSAGDRIEASAYQSRSSGTWVTRLDDLTTGVSGFMETGGGWGTILDSDLSRWRVLEGRASSVSYSGGYTAEWIAEAYTVVSGGQSQLAPLADFGTIRFTNLRASTPPLISDFIGAVGLEDSSGKWLLATPSASQGDGFSVVYTG